MTYPFELEHTELAGRLNEMVDAVWGSLQSNFLTLPKGEGFVPYARFAEAYDVLRSCTKGFQQWDFPSVLQAFNRDKLVFVVVRAMLGFSPPEWAYLTTTRHGFDIDQGQARRLDRQFRESGKRITEATLIVVRAMLSTAVDILRDAPPQTPSSLIHRLDQADTTEGIASVQYVANAGVPYAMLLYERFLGRPFASHRDAVSGQVGDLMEMAVEDELAKAGIFARKTRRAEKVPGFDQAPDFIYPDEWRPLIVVEAKITEDDGTARDKVTRIQHLLALSREREAAGGIPFQVVACIDGRGFGVRREDMKKLIAATGGKVFTLKTLNQLVDQTRFREYRTR